MKAVLLENHPLLRAGLAQVLAHPTLGLEEVSAPEWPHAPLDPADLLVVGIDDANVPLDAAQLRGLIAQSTPRHVVVLAARVTAEEAHAAMACGADAYVAKTQPTGVLLATLQLVLAGGQAYPALMPRAPQDVAGPPAISAAEAAQRLNVSQRQYEVLVLLSRGHSVKGVGRLLGISEATVKTHACTLYRRLNVRNKSEAVYAVMRLGIPLELHGNPALAPAGDRLPEAVARAGVPRAAIEAVEAPACVPSSRPAGNEPADETRWAAMTRAFGVTAAPKGGRSPVRVANGAHRPGMG
ncbi:response regulator transcription factor [Ralstonia solanacearum]|uniref:response regulator transcription factor n=1 Tax=Ralstonia solanacearum TaxID=305 RepID=UPI00078B5B92|nr:response regulator transcription factor [Ralstonia solanacearum]AMP39413.1 LuxR family transcriptional regulator [Ralstonia solanacearum]AXV88248.1 DNA-binding response regulator [Ralstonia solanacearum]AXW07728.1 DNA-binding response regulator [Ralstonia solanacearum]AXW25521.1 DNA-binding response regulator [Ralstonia solanacearum]AXW82433.1 DNA-binding response regulator [Ralstonia solanacearum]